MKTIPWHHMREPVSGLSHLLGAILSIVALILLLYHAITLGNPTAIVAFSIYGLSLILLYMASSLYHLVPGPPSEIRTLRKFDHTMIYVLIAGTYTPLILLVLNGYWKWSSITCIWILAAIGIIIKLVWFRAPRWLSTMLYLGMGWLSVIIMPVLIRNFATAGLLWLLAGGLAYTVGAIIYGAKKPDPIPKVFGFHEIWHIFVLVGSFCHFWSIYHYLPPT